MPVSRKRKKLHGLPPSHGMDRNLRVRIMAYAHTWNAAHKTGRQHTGPITRTFMIVLQKLVWGFANTKTGSCFPSYDAIAERAGCARSVAINAVNVLEAAGVLQVFNRLKRVGVRVLRTSNAYVFRDPGAGSENQSGNQESKESAILAAQPAVKIIVLNPKSPLDAALIGLGRANGYLEAVP